MSKLARRASHYLLIGTLLVSLGGHLALLQTVAWGSMLVGFSRTESLEEAAKKTFDGKHPCHLCKVVKESKSQEERKPLVKSEMKLDVVLPLPVFLKEPRSVPVVTLPPVYLNRDSDVSLGVPLQPPRAV
jgi:hypothetical protein